MSAFGRLRLIDEEEKVIILGRRDGILHRRRIVQVLPRDAMAAWLTAFPCRSERPPVICRPGIGLLPRADGVDLFGPGRRGRRCRGPRTNVRGAGRAGRGSHDRLHPERRAHDARHRSTDVAGRASVAPTALVRRAAAGSAFSSDAASPDRTSAPGTSRPPPGESRRNALPQRSTARGERGGSTPRRPRGPR